MFPVLSKKKSNNPGNFYNSIERIKIDKSDSPKKKTVYTKKLWTDTTPPDSIEEIYKSCEYRMSQLEKKINEYDLLYKIDEPNLFQTTNYYSIHLTRLRVFMGLAEIKSAKTITDILRIINYNLRMIRKENKLRSQQALSLPNLIKDKESEETSQEPKESLSTQAKIENSPVKLPDINQKEEESKANSNLKSILAAVNPPATVNNAINSKPDNESEHLSDDEDQEKSKEKEQPKSILHISNSDLLNYVMKKRPPPPPLESIKNDPVINPLIVSLKKNYMIITREAELDSSILSEYFETIMNAMDTRYSELLNEIESLCNLFEKYFQSFLQNNFDDLRQTYEKDRLVKKKQTINHKNLTQTEELMDSAFEYNSKIKEYMAKIHSSIRALRRLKRKFDDGTTNGVYVKDFSSQSQNLSMRYECDLVPVVLILFEHSTQLKACLKLLKEWLAYDKSYPKLVMADLKEVDKRKKNLNTQKYNMEVMYNQLMYKIGLFKNNIEVQEKELNEMYKKREAKFGEDSIDEESLLISNERRIFMRYFKYQDFDCLGLLERTEDDLNQLEIEFVKLCAANNANQSTNLKGKETILQIREKFEQIENLKKRLENLEYQLEHLFEEKKIKSNEIDLLENCYFKLKEIHMYKSVPQTLYKIFFNLPLPSLKFDFSFDQLIKYDSDGCVSPVVLGTSNKDDLSACLSLISKMLEADWVKLYYQLPFYPERGGENIKKDIDDVFIKIYRGDAAKQQALYALKKWRRLHARAKIDDLRIALNNIGRSDIIRAIEKYFKRTEKKERKKSSIIEIDQKKQEAELLHQNLTKFFERKKNEPIKAFQIRYYK